MNKGNAETPEERAAVLAAVAVIWEKWPQLRLCQLLAAVADKSDPFYTVDQVLLDYDK